MISKEIAQAINKQINAEFWSGYFYLSMACHFESAGLKGVANWFRIQQQEEFDHARILINHLTARNGRVELYPIEAVPTEWESPMAAFAATLVHEQKVTAAINELYCMADKAKDYATRQMLNWFVAEQVEEEENVQDILDTLKLIGNDGTGLYQYDRELASRTYTAPSILSE